MDVGFSGSWKFTRFTKNQHPVTEAPKNKIVNLSDQKLEDGTLSQKGLNYAVAPRATPVEEILVEKAEEAWQESVRIIKTTTRNKDNLTKIERMALRTLKDNTHLTILPADKGKATVILNTTDYNLKIASLL